MRPGPLAHLNLDELYVLQGRVSAQIEPAEEAALVAIESAIQVARSKRLCAGPEFDPFKQYPEFASRPEGDEIALENLITQEAKTAWSRARSLRYTLDDIETAIAWKEDGCP